MKTENPSIVAIAGAGALALFCMHRPAASEATSSALLGHLNTVGYVIYLRHSITDTTWNDADPIDIADCSTQRPRSDAGRALARKMVLRAAYIPVDQVISSPYCRAVETAALELANSDRWYAILVTSAKTGAHGRHG